MDNKVYAKLITPEEFNGISLKDISQFPCDYILRCIEGRYEGRQFLLSSLGEIITIGTSDECNFQINDYEISSKHCVLKHIKNTIYYELLDLKSDSGTWLKINVLEDDFEVIETTEFKIHNHHFVIEFNQNQIHTLRFTKGKNEKSIYNLDDDSDIFIGKDKKCTIELSDLPTTEDYSFRIVKTNKRVFITICCYDLNNDGLYYRVKSDENNCALIRAGDFIKIGRNTLRVLIHNWGLTNEIGDRTYQEDKYCLVDDLRIFDSIVVPYYAVYDGHGGYMCSIFLQKYFHKTMRDLIKMNKNLEESNNFFVDFCKIVQDAIIYTDFTFKEKETNFAYHQGSTCVGLFFIGNKVICCNLGDSISILVRKDKNIHLSKDFRPFREKEKERIKYLKGTITDEGRMLGIINVSRSFGDWKFKEPNNPVIARQQNIPEFKDYLMSNRAEFRIFEIDHKIDEYIILASDGILQYSNCLNIFEMIGKHLKDNDDELKDIPSVIDNFRLDLVNLNTENIQGKKHEAVKLDNMTLVFIHLQNN
jgi:serine/threonine protein phosphatase PrpC